MKKALKTDIIKACNRFKSKFQPGHIPYLLQNRSQIKFSGNSLRPGGMKITCAAMEICNFSNNDRILDAGCGYGMSSRYFNEAYGIKAVGIDTEQSMLASTQKKACHNRLVQSKIPALPFKSNSFKGIFCEQVLSLITEKSKCLKNFYRILKTNGKLVLTDIYMPELFKKIKSNPKLKGAITIIDMIKKLESAGFNIDFMEDYTRHFKEFTNLSPSNYKAPDTIPDNIRVNLTINTPSTNDIHEDIKPGYCMIIAGKY